MKKLFLLLGFALPFIVEAQTTASCCSAPATAQFALLGNDASFVNSHQAPLPFHLQRGKGRMIQFKTADGKTGSAYEVKSEKSSGKYLIIIHEWWGLNDYIKQEAEKFEDELGEINILALDLYDGKVADKPEDAQQIMQSCREERTKAIINGALAYVGPAAHIQTIGWCFGGGWSLQTALFAGKQNKGCVMYYGMPEKNVERLKTLNAPVLGIFGSRDEWINCAVVDEFRQNMQKAGKELIVKKYDAVHAFANPSNPEFDMEKANDAHVHAVEFLRANFK